MSDFMKRMEVMEQLSLLPFTVNKAVACKATVFGLKQDGLVDVRISGSLTGYCLSNEGQAYFRRWRRWYLIRRFGSALRQDLVDVRDGLLLLLVPTQCVFCYWSRLLLAGSLAALCAQVSNGYVIAGIAFTLACLSAAIVWLSNLR